ncbi:MAG: hypothetical protein P8M55_05805, partial [Gammaproteobacteria bacterium]|nr:hypothetical protein [Gammaproteobacteria bacterium]
MTRKQSKALRRSKAIKKKQNILRIKNRAKSVAVVAAATAVLATPNINAQGTIEEIVVTSRKKEETLQDVPLQVSTLTEQ